MFVVQILIAWLAQTLRALWTNRATPWALVENISWRKVVFLVALLLAVAALTQLVAVDMALFWAGDVALCCEIASAVMLVVVRGHIRQAAQMARLKLNRSIRRARIWRRRSLNARQRRSVAKPRTGGKNADDCSGGWLGGVWALQPV